MVLTKHYTPSLECGAAFLKACDLFNQGHFYDATGQTRKMFDIDMGSSGVSVEIVWCDHLPSLRFIYPGMIEFMLSGNKLVCMVQCEQLRARTISVAGVCHAVNLMIHAVQSGTLSATPVLFDAADGLAMEAPAKIAYCSNSATDYLVMDPEFAFSDGYAAVRQAAVALPTWNERVDKVVWRGATTGQVSTAVMGDDGPQPENWDWLQRLKLCAVAAGSRHLDFLDIGVSNIVQLGEEQAASVRASSFMRAAIKRQDFGLFRYAVDIDGNTNAWSGLFTKLLMGCCVLKVDSPLGFRQWYYKRMKPWEHYAPVAADLSDFDEVVDRLRRDPRLSANIAASGQALAEAVTMKDSLLEATSMVNRVSALSV